LVIILALCIPVTALVTGFFTLKGVHLGLKWQYEIKHEEKPSMVIPNPVEPILEARQKERQENLLNEWLNGVPEESR
jgi:hypothetical protein